MLCYCFLTDKCGFFCFGTESRARKDVVGTEVQLAVVCMQISNCAFSGFIVKLQMLER